MGKKVALALIGAGLRGQGYTDYALEHPSELQVVAVADPNPARREKMRILHGIEERGCFSDWRDLLAVPKLADAVLICTQDRMHFEPTLQALDAGYHVLLEKPMSPDPREVAAMGDKAEDKGLVFSVCHVLRYTGFFGTLKRLLAEGAIGKLQSIQHNENVGYWHQAHSFVRGNWRNSAESSPMILQKSCHDMDILLWLAGADCVSISSFGSLSHFRSEDAPAGAPERCTDGCPVAGSCVYYAPDIYLNEDPGWLGDAISDDPSPEARRKALETGPYGRCVYRCDNDVVDHQVVIAEFANGVTAAFTMTAFTKDTSRTLKLMGTEGEIRASMENDDIVLYRFDESEGRKIPLNKAEHGQSGGHGGGDGGIVADFVRLVREDGKVQGLTSAANSVQSHMMAFAAEHARLNREVVRLSEFSQRWRSNLLQI